MEISRMQEIGHNYGYEHSTYWDNMNLGNKLDFSYEALLDFDFSPDEWPLWNHCVADQNQSEFSSMEEITGLSNESQNDRMEFVYDDELLDLNDSPLWNDSIIQETGLLYPCSKKDFPSKQEDSVTIEDVPCDSQLDSDLTIAELDIRSGEDRSYISIETMNTSTSGEGLISWETDSSEYKGLRLVHLLTACAEATSNGAPELVEILLGRLKEIASPTGSNMERVAYYLFQALQHRYECTVDGQMENHLLNSNGVSKANFLGAFLLLNRAYPYIEIAHFTANQSILEAIPVRKQQCVHIIDFDIMDGMQWPSLMQSLKNEDYQIDHLKITAVKWVDDSSPFSSCCKDTGSRLSEYATSLGIPFLFQETEMKNMEGMISSNEDEIVIVNCMWELPHMFERSRNQLLDFINGARHLNPVVLTLGTGPNGISSYENLNFMERFAQCLRNLCAMFDSLEAGLGEQYGFARAMVEHLFFGPMMCRPINYMSNDELFPVMHVPLKFGLVERVISQKSIMDAKFLVSCKNGGRFYDLESAGNGQLLLNWDSTPLTCVSAWSVV